jgi:aminopeptidase N
MRAAGLAFAILWGACAGLAHAASPSIDLQVELDPATRRFDARAEVVPAARDFHFMLHESLEVRAASASGKAVRIAAGAPTGGMRDWRATLPAEGGTLLLEYGGTLPMLERGLDHRGVLRGLPPMASNEGSFLPAGGGWYPQPAPLFSYRVSLSLPADQRALVAGRLLSEETGGRYRASFEFAQPADGIDLMAGPWVVREKMAPRPSGPPLRLRTYFTRELDPLAEGYLDDTQRYLERYSERIGAYPFSEFSVVASPLPTGFGMPTLTYLGAEVLKLPFIRATSLGHEILHNWWGNGVYVDYAGGNWAEGLTTFMADYAYKEDQSAEAARAMRLGWLRDFAAAPADSQPSLASFRSRTHGAEAAVGYGKSAMLFVMLRDTIGEEAFARGIRAFWEAHQFRRASWDDLRRAFERAAGRPLGAFFAQWLERRGGPEVAIAGATQKDKTRLALVLRQSTPAYALRLPVELVFAEGAEGTETRWIDLAQPSATVVLDLARMPEGVRLDPDLRVWRVLDQPQLPPILRQWIVARAPRLLHASPQTEVRDAADTLAKRLFEAAPQTIAPGDLPQAGGPALLIGLQADVDAALARAGLPSRPTQLAGRGSAQVWTIVRESGTPVAVVSARDTEALRALLRPLPHYGAQSWLAFEGSRALDRGVWPAPGKLIPVQEGR